MLVNGTNRRGCFMLTWSNPLRLDVINLVINVCAEFFFLDCIFVVAVVAVVVVVSEKERVVEVQGVECFKLGNLFGEFRGSFRAVLVSEQFQSSFREASISGQLQSSFRAVSEQ